MKLIYFVWFGFHDVAIDKSQGPQYQFHFQDQAWNVNRSCVSIVKHFLFIPQFQLVAKFLFPPKRRPITATSIFLNLQCPGGIDDGMGK